MPIPNRQNWCVDTKATPVDYTRDELIDLYEARMFNKVNRMLEFEDLPKEIPHRDFLLYLQTKGETAVVKVGDTLYAIRDLSGTELDAYYHPTKYVLTNPYVKGLKPFYIKGKDCAIIKHDSMCVGLYPLIHKYATLLTDIHITFSLNVIIERSPYLLSVADGKTKEELNAVIQALKQGNLQIALDKASMLKANTITPLQYGCVPVGSIKELIELENYLSSSLLMELGLNSNYNMKREYVNSNENQIDGLTLIPSIEDILTTIQIGLDEMNSLFGTTTKVKLGKAWLKIEEEVMEDNDNQDGNVDEDNIEDTKEESKPDEKGDEDAKD